MLRNKFTTLIAATGLALTFSVACDDGDDGETGASTGGGATSNATNDTEDTAETNDTEDTAETNDTKASTSTTSDTADTEDTADTSDTVADASTGEPDPCADVVCEDGQECIGGQCLDTGETTGVEGCPDGETCQMTGAGTMACLGDASHCVLGCGAAIQCPDTMSCQAGACQYDLSGGAFPTEGLDSVYTVAMTCPKGYFAMPVSFAMNYAVCAPECDGSGPQAACPAADSGTAVGACLLNPTSSGMPC